MKPVRRELLNGLFVLVVGALMSTAFEAFHVNFDGVVWALIVMGLAIAVSGYAVFESVMSAEERDRATTESTRKREEEWLKRMGTPTKFEPNPITPVIDVLKAMTPGNDYTVMYYFDPGGGASTAREVDLGRAELYRVVFDLLQRGTIREYKRIVCFDNEVLANDPELRSGILRVGTGPGTIDQLNGDHCRAILETKNCSLYVAPAVFRAIIALCGPSKVSFTLETVEQGAGGRANLGTLLFSDPPNGEIVEQFRQIERATERRMVAVHKIRFPEDEAPTASLATR
jgi:hypothetical protein